MEKNAFEEEVKQSLEVLNSGGILLYPTDTVWGLGCDALNEKAISRLYEIKKRADNKSMILLLDNENKILSYVQQVPEIAWTLIEFAERPLTIIYDNPRNLPEKITSDAKSVAIRVTKDPFCKRLLERFRKPIVSTSANFSGEATPANFSEISEEIRSAADYVVNLKREDKTEAKPSDIVRLRTNGQIEFIR